MKNLILTAVILISVFSCGQNKRPIQGETEFQKTINAEYKDVSTSPLKDKDRKEFESLEFFKFDSTFVVEARLKRVKNAEWFNMKTTTDRVSKERVFGVLSFELKGQEFNLNVYQGQELMQEEGFEDYLFLPFLDETNGLESYGGGRYIDLKIPDSDRLIIDFNKAYNPYCAYNDKYSCPITPRINYLKTRVNAGVKAFGEH
ncbi:MULTISPECIES: DUF1684 domain-containing protein [unclassified Algibacter]|uniref:DUF1684 domain-containing protein n=1 Tax=unclassified Algibacter TaxID=2615009 RepID=UPI00131D5460|nr:MULTISPECIES: DUF1684 domain-containing protein [unclassified Algibacter]MCL5128762.1 DUF1684 domain-containing protein [Algibacter sp. L4_22]